MSEIEKQRYVFPHLNDYAPVATDIIGIVSKGLRSDKQNIMARDVLITLILKTTKINLRNNKSDLVRPYESSARELAVILGVTHRAICNAIEFLRRNEWLFTEKGIEDKRKTLYILNIEKITDLFLSHKTELLQNRD